MKILLGRLTRNSKNTDVVVIDQISCPSSTQSHAVLQHPNAAAARDQSPSSWATGEKVQILLIAIRSPETAEKSFMRWSLLRGYCYDAYSPNSSDRQTTTTQQKTYLAYPDGMALPLQDEAERYLRIGSGGKGNNIQRLAQHRPQQSLIVSASTCTTYLTALFGLLSCIYI